MTPEEYKIKLKSITEEFKNAERSIAREFAISNNPYKIGDIITDHIGSIKITEIKWTFGSFNDLPSCLYVGRELKKNLTPTKKESFRTVYQKNIK